MTLTTPVRFDLPITVELDRSEDGRFVARNDELRIAVTGATSDEAVAAFGAGVRDLIDFCREQRLPLPAALVALLQNA